MREPEKSSGRICHGPPTGRGGSVRPKVGRDTPHTDEAASVKPLAVAPRLTHRTFLSVSTAHRYWGNGAHIRDGSTLTARLIEMHSVLGRGSRSLLYIHNEWAKRRVYKMLDKRRGTRGKVYGKRPRVFIPLSCCRDVANV